MLFLLVLYSHASTRYLDLEIVLRKLCSLSKISSEFHEAFYSYNKSCSLFVKGLSSKKQSSLRNNMFRMRYLHTNTALLKTVSLLSKLRKISIHSGSEVRIT